MDNRNLIVKKNSSKKGEKRSRTNLGLVEKERKEGKEKGKRKKKRKNEWKIKKSDYKEGNR